MESYPGAIPEGRRPEIKIIGSGAEELKAGIQEVFSLRFGDEHFAELPEKVRIELERAEYKKRTLEVAYIQKANELTNKILIRCGATPFNIPDKNIHFIPEDVYKKIRGAEKRGCFSSREQAIYINGDPDVDPLIKAAVCLHEIIHMKEYMVVEVSERKLRWRRGGLTVQSSIRELVENESENEVGRGLNEAITTELSKELFFQMVEEIEPLTDELEWTKTDLYKRKREYLEKAHTWEENELIRNEDGRWETFGYDEQRRIVAFIVKEIASDGLLEENEIRSLFYKAHFTGDLSLLTQTINRAFGSEAFKKIMQMTTDDESAKETLTFLKEKRQAIKKQFHV